MKVFNKINMSESAFIKNMTLIQAKKRIKKLQYGTLVVFSTSKSLIFLSS